MIQQRVDDPLRRLSITKDIDRPGHLCVTSGVSQDPGHIPDNALRFGSDDPGDTGSHSLRPFGHLA